MERNRGGKEEKEKEKERETEEMGKEDKGLAKRKRELEGLGFNSVLTQRMHNRRCVYMRERGRKCNDLIQAQNAIEIARPKIHEEIKPGQPTSTLSKRI